MGHHRRHDVSGPRQTALEAVLKKDKQMRPRWLHLLPATCRLRQFQVLIRREVDAGRTAHTKEGDLGVIGQRDRCITA